MMSGTLPGLAESSARWENEGGNKMIFYTSGFLPGLLLSGTVIALGFFAGAAFKKIKRRHWND